MLVLELVAYYAIDSFAQTLSLRRADNAEITYLRLAILHDDLIPMIVDGVTEADVTSLQNRVGLLNAPAEAVLHARSPVWVVVVRSDEIRQVDAIHFVGILIGLTRVANLDQVDDTAETGDGLWRTWWWRTRGRRRRA